MNELQIISSQIILQFFVRNNSDGKSDIKCQHVTQLHRGLDTRVVLYWLQPFS